MATPELGLSPVLATTTVPYTINQTFNINGLKGSVPVSGAPARSGGGIAAQVLWPLYSPTNWFSLTAGANGGGEWGGDHSTQFWSAHMGARFSQSAADTHFDIKLGYGGYRLNSQDGNSLVNGAFTSVGGIANNVGIDHLQLGLGLEVTTDGTSSQIRIPLTIGWRSGAPKAAHKIKPETLVQFASDVASSIQNLYGHSMSQCVPFDPIKTDEGDYLLQLSSLVDWITKDGTYGSCDLPQIDPQMAAAKNALSVARSLPGDPAPIDAAATNLDKSKSIVARKVMELLLGAQKSSLSRAIAEGKTIRDMKIKKDALTRLHDYEGTLNALNSVQGRAATALDMNGKSSFAEAIATVNCLVTGTTCPSDFDDSISLPKLKELIGKK